MNLFLKISFPLHPSFYLGKRIISYPLIYLNFAMTLEGKYHHSHFIAAYNIHRLRAATKTFGLFSFYPQRLTNKKRKLNVKQNLLSVLLKTSISFWKAAQTGG